MWEHLIRQRLSRLPDAAARGLAVELPDGRHIGATPARVCLRPRNLLALGHLASGQIGRLASDYVEDLLRIDGPIPEAVALGVHLLDTEPTRPTPLALGRRLGSRWRHRPRIDALQVQHHYDISDDFYALWLDARRVYSCGYWPQGVATLAAAQEAKLELICRKLALRPGQRFLDIGAGWGGLLLWAAEHHGVQATGITLSANQHRHVQRLIAERGLQDRVRMHLLDYRELPENQPFDRIASVGMFEHVGHARLPEYFAKIRRLLRPGGLLLNHGITAGGTRHAQLAAGIGDFVERYIFPGGELLHISHVLRVMAEQGLEGLDTENLRPHYARTLWAWSAGLEAALDAAAATTDARTLRAFRMYLAGSAVAFERGWMALHQTLAARPTGPQDTPPAQAAACDYPFERGYMYR